MPLVHHPIKEVEAMVPFTCDKAKLNLRGVMQDVSDSVEALVPSLGLHFMLRFLLTHNPKAKEFMQVFGRLPTQTISAELDGPALKMTGLCTYEVDEFVIHEGAFLVLPVRFTWTRREVEIK